MSNSLHFAFSLDKETKSILITREFKSSLEWVWQAWTKAELLDQWWAPRPYHIETKSLDFREGGMWLYAMVNPTDEKMWCKADYQRIDTHRSLSWLDAFCDENGLANTIKPRSLWVIHFTENNGITTVDARLQHENLEDVEMMIEMGFKEGFSMAMGNLEELLITVNK